MGCRGPRGGRRRTRRRASRRSSRPGHGWGPGRWRRCSSGWPGRSVPSGCRRCGWPVAGRARRAGRRLVAIDGTCLDVADTAANAEYFARPGVNKGEQAAFPQARVVALAECGTHAVFAAEVGRYSQSEATLTESLLARLEPGMLLSADRGFFSYALWRKAIGTGADLLWRVRTDQAGPKPIPLEDLPDGSWLAHLRRSTPAAARREDPMLVRVIDYTIDDGRA